MYQYEEGSKTEPKELYIRSVRISREIPEESYLSALPVVAELAKLPEGLHFDSRVTFLVGENGVGKSTLIEAVAIAMGFNPEGGTVNFNFHTENTHSELYRYITVSKGTRRHRDGFFLRAESFYNVATNIDEMDREDSLGAPVIMSYGGVSLHRQSHGESFMALVKNRFGGNGLYILDEPEAALSPMRQLELMGYINELVRKNSQFIISTHSPILMTFPDADVIELSDSIRRVPYFETEHFRAARRLINAPEKTREYLR